MASSTVDNAILFLHARIHQNVPVSPRVRSMLRDFRLGESSLSELLQRDSARRVVAHQELFDVLSKDVDFEIYRGTDPPVQKCYVVTGETYKRDGEPVRAGVDNGQARPTYRDEAFGHDIAHQRGGRREPNDQAIAIGPHVNDLASCIDVALDDVSAQSAVYG